MSAAELVHRYGNIFEVADGVMGSVKCKTCVPLFVCSTAGEMDAHYEMHYTVEEFNAPMVAAPAAVVAPDVAAQPAVELPSAYGSGATAASTWPGVVTHGSDHFRCTMCNENIVHANILHHIGTAKHVAKVHSAADAANFAAQHPLEFANRGGQLVCQRQRCSATCSGAQSAAAHLKAHTDDDTRFAAMRAFVKTHTATPAAELDWSAIDDAPSTRPLRCNCCRALFATAELADAHRNTAAHKTKSRNGHSAAALSRFAATCRRADQLVRGTAAWEFTDDARRRLAKVRCTLCKASFFCTRDAEAHRNTREHQRSVCASDVGRANLSFVDTSDRRDGPFGSPRFAAECAVFGEVLIACTLCARTFADADAAQAHVSTAGNCKESTEVNQNQYMATALFRHNSAFSREGDHKKLTKEQADALVKDFNDNFHHKLAASCCERRRRTTANSQRASRRTKRRGSSKRKAHRASSPRTSASPRTSPTARARSTQVSPSTRKMRRSPGPQSGARSRACASPSPPRWS